MSFSWLWVLIVLVVFVPFFALLGMFSYWRFHLRCKRSSYTDPYSVNSLID